MKKFLPTLACLAVVILASAAARWTAAASWNSVVHYQSPYIFHRAHPSGPALARRVLLVVLDGVRVDVSRQMRFLNELRARGADGTARVGLPSLSNPGRAVLATGAWQEVHGVTYNTTYGPVTADSLFSLARASGLKTAVAGGKFWNRAFGNLVTENLGPLEVSSGLAPEALVDWQRRTCDSQEKFLRASQAQLLVVDLSAEDDAAHDFGPLSLEAATVLAAVDDCLRKVVGTVDLRETAVIAVADHGHIARGGHGGDEPPVINVPLVLAGGPVRPGVRLKAEQVDVAPTICALLGLPFPSTNQGQALTEALDAPPDALRNIQQRQARQLAEFQAAAARLLGGTRQYAINLARMGRTFRATAALLLLLLLAAWVLLRVCLLPAERRALVTGLLVFYLAYFALFGVGNLGYSPSAVNRDEYLPSFFMKDMLFAGGALVVAAFATGLALRERQGAAGAVRLAAALSAAVTITLLLQVVLVYWFNGLRMTLWMLDLRWGFKAYLDMLATFALAFSVWLTPPAFYAAQRLRSPLFVKSEHP